MARKHIQPNTATQVARFPRPRKLTKIGENSPNVRHAASGVIFLNVSAHTPHQIWTTNKTHLSPGSKDSCRAMIANEHAKAALLIQAMAMAVDSTHSPTHIAADTTLR